VDIRKLLGLPDLLDVRKVIAIQPHPDDNEVFVGGILRALHQRGCDITYVTVTDGRAGAFGTQANPRQIVAVRQREKQAAGEIIGVSQHIDLGFPDGGDYSVASVAAQLVEVFRAHQPALVLTVDAWMPYEAHPDHVKVGRATAQALLFSNNEILYPADRHPAFAVPQVAFYATSYPNTFVDITAHWDDKRAAIFAHRSQFDNEKWPLMQQYFAALAAEMYQQKYPGEQGLAEAVKVLATEQLHGFPGALYS